MWWTLWTCIHVGVSGNVLINENADRVNSYNVWNYAEGQDRTYRSMLIDLTQPTEKVNGLRWNFCFISGSRVVNVTEDIHEIHLRKMHIKYM